MALLAKDMASDYEQIDPAQSYAERSGITSRDRVVEIVRRIVPEKLRDRIGPTTWSPSPAVS